MILCAPVTIKVALCLIFFEIMLNKKKATSTITALVALVVADLTIAKRPQSMPMSFLFARRFVLLLDLAEGIVQMRLH